MKIGILFSGQGSQVPGMGKDLYENYQCFRDLYDKANLSFDLKKISFESDAKTLKQTKYTQPTLVAFHLGAFRILKEMGIEFDYGAGLSLGEFSALGAAEILTEKEVLEIIEKRAGYMAESLEGKDSSMIALIGASPKEAVSLCDFMEDKGFFAEIANMNCPGQIVLGVMEDGKKPLMVEAKSRGLRSIPLDVEGAFHTSLMSVASEKLEELLLNYDFKEEKIPIIHNYTGDFNQDESYIDLLSMQASHTTYFQKTLEKMVDLGVGLFIEVGYNEIFKGFLKRVKGDFEVVSLSTKETFKEFERNYGK